jgi:MFS family permease
MLYTSQILQGASSAILYTVGLAVLVDTVGTQHVGKWLGTAMSFNSFGLVMGPAIGGIVYEQAPAGKLAVFGITIALGAIGIVLRLLMKEQPKIIESVSSDTSTNSMPLDSLVQDLDASERNRKGPEHTFTTTTSAQHDDSSAPLRCFRLRHVWILLKSPQFLTALFGIFLNEL